MLMNRINLLPENLINQIAAGEVIERPASVVKELVENSIDAGATRIEVQLSNECRNIRIADNGHGIHKDDIGLAFSRHATSKLIDENSLWELSTLGFRGEALASIISIAKVSCYSRTEDMDTGVKAECENSQISVTESGCAVGTVMEVNDIFYNVPARSKFLKKSQTEFSYVSEIVQNIALSHPQISFVLLNSGKSVLRTTGSGDLLTAITEVYSKDMANQLVEVYKEDKTEGLVVRGYASKPEFTRTSKKAIYLFVNNRAVKCPVLLKAVDTAYKDLIPSGKYPFCVLSLDIPPASLDVNVHPSKREVRYTKANQIFNLVIASIKSAVEDLGFVKFQPASTVAFNAYANDVYTAEETKKTSFMNKAIPSFKREYEVDDSAQTFSFVESVKSKQEYEDEQVTISFAPMPSVAVEQQVPRPKIVGQYFNTYILVEHNEGLQIIDQHIAHERTIYERLKDSKEFASQLLLSCVPVEVDDNQAELMLENAELLSRYGYKFEVMNSNRVILKQVPVILAGKNPESTVVELIKALEGSVEQIENEILITTSCHAAVKAGEKLSVWQMEEIIRDWQMTKNNGTCPHGRVIAKIIPLKEVASFFGRSV